MNAYSDMTQGQSRSASEELLKGELLSGVVVAAAAYVNECGEVELFQSLCQKQSRQRQQQQQQQERATRQSAKRLNLLPRNRPVNWISFSLARSCCYLGRTCRCCCLTQNHQLNLKLKLEFDAGWTPLAS